MNPVEFYDKFADRYDRFYSGPDVEAEDRVWLEELRQLGPVVDTGEVIDIGCGTGALLDHIQDGTRYLGIDAAPRGAGRRFGRRAVPSVRRGGTCLVI